MKPWPQTSKILKWPLSVLLGHLISTAVVFSTVYTLRWIASVLFDHLNAISAFQPAIVRLAKALEIGCFYVDALGSAVFLSYQMVRINWHTWEGR